MLHDMADVTPEKDPGTHWTEGWVGLYPDKTFGEGTLLHSGESNHDPSVIQPTAHSLYQICFSAPSFEDLTEIYYFLSHLTLW
jgi:hypothetical protein